MSRRHGENEEMQRDISEESWRRRGEGHLKMKKTCREKETVARGVNGIRIKRLGGF